MAKNLGTLTVDLVLKLGGFQQGANRAQREFNQFSRSLQRDVRTLTSTFARFAGAIGAGFGFAEIVRSTAEAERAFALLENAVRNNAGAAAQTAEQLAETASALQRVTTFSDEAIQSAQTLLLSFRSIRGDAFDEATEAALDLATALGKDLPSAALLVGKALEDPVKGMTQLARAGVVFSAEQKKVIERLAETGRAAEAQAIILDGLNSRFANAARAARDNFAGALEGLRNQFGELLEAKGGLPEATQAINDFSDTLADPATRQAVDLLTTSIVRLGSAAVKAFTIAADGVGALIDLVQTVPNATAGLLNLEFDVDLDPSELEREINRIEERLERVRSTEALLIPAFVDNAEIEALEKRLTQLRAARIEGPTIVPQVEGAGFGNLTEAEIEDLEKLEEAAKKASRTWASEMTKLAALRERARGTVFEIDDQEFAALAAQITAEFEKPKKAIDSTRSSIDSFIESLEREQATLGASAADAQRYTVLHGEIADALAKLGPAADGLRAKLLHLIDVGEQQAATREIEEQIQALREEAATVGLTADELFEYQLTQAALEGQLGKTAEEQARLTQEWRDAHEALKDAQDDKLIVEGMADVEQEMLEIMGRTTEAAVRATEERFRALREAIQREIARGGEEGAAAQRVLVTLEARIELEGFRAQAEAFRDEVERIRSDFARREQTIEVRIEAGTVSEIGGRRELINLHQDEAAALEEVARQWGEVAAAARAAGTPIPEMEQDVLDLQATIEDLKTTTDEFGKIAADAFETGLADSLTDLATGVSSLKEAAVDFLDGINEAIVRWASEQVAASVRDVLFGQGGVLGDLGGIFGGGGGVIGSGPVPGIPGATSLAAGGLEEIAVTAQRLPEAGAEAASATALTAAATALTASATALTASGTALASGAATFVTGATSLITAGTTLTTAAAALSGAAATLASSAAAGFAGDGLGEILITTARLAEGGKVFGPGTGTSDSIPAMLSAGEFVVKAAAVQQPGVQALLEQINDGAVFRSLTPPRLPTLRFADGGMVPSLTQLSQSPTHTAPGATYNIQIPISAPTGSVSQSTQLQVSAAVARGIRTADARNNR